MSKRSGKVASAAILILAVAVIAGPAAAHRGRGAGKKPMGTVTSFDGTTLTVTTTSGEVVTGTVTEDTKVKKEHRGHHSRSGNPSNGTVEDLTAGTFVLRMKLDDGVVEKIRVRSGAPHEAEEPETEEPETEEEAVDDESDGDETETDEDETETEDDEADEATDDETGETDPEA